MGKVSWEKLEGENIEQSTGIVFETQCRHQTIYFSVLCNTVKITNNSKPDWNSANPVETSWADAYLVETRLRISILVFALHVLHHRVSITVSDITSSRASSLTKGKLK